MSLAEHYKLALSQPDMVHDDAQQQAIIKLEALTTALTSDDKHPLLAIIKRFSPLKRHRKKTIKGIYLWGGVGRGKTWLMNLFYEELPIKEKSRVHYHHLMLNVHDQLAELNNKKGKKQKNPVRIIARQLAKKYKVLCIDEFIVTNITDAMILSELLSSLFKHQVCLIATSNRIPDDLYLNGLQRERFLPSIELIKRHTEVFQLDGGVDHRTALLEQTDVYYSPVTEETDQQITQKMDELAITKVIENKTLNILNRTIRTIRCSDDIAWFDFEDICSAPRAAQDYIELAQIFNTIIVSNIPIMDADSDDKARRFIYLIDDMVQHNPSPDTF